ncbi:hypothetical protein FF011L_51600 [Roseimaritima multifibrata]|uniref:Uncharacterized protein n=1 Tax=Roseimaritima multifibrata TaxID=1930274 RepID=A0A517MN93_9BACT|nr:glycosyltransferase [Roseimaritima multifibrata]QDS96352.1 hypothetical protein FF011L_51600 [Roseimaritima multifibrata]
MRKDGSMIDPFECSVIFDQEVRGFFQERKTRFPYAVLALENEVRMSLSGAPHVNQVLRNNYADFRLRSQLKKMGRWLVWKVSNRFFAKNKLRYQVALSRTPVIETEVVDFLDEEGLERFTECSLPLGVTLSLQEVATKGTAFSLLGRISTHEEFSSLLKNERFMLQFNRAVRKNVFSVRNFLSQEKIALLVVHDAHHVAGRIICAAAEQCGIPVVEVAHGYTQCPNLISVSPVIASVEVVWSDQLASRIRCFGLPSDRCRVVSFGFPKSLVCRCPLPRFRQALVLVNPISRMSVREREIYHSEMSHVLRMFCDHGWLVKLRVHPSEKYLSVVADFFCDFDVILRKDTLENDLANSRIVVGTASSVLVEALFNGIPVIQLAGDKDIRLEHLTVKQSVDLAWNDVESILSNANNRHSSNVPEFRSLRFREFLIDLVQDCSLI